MISRLSSLPLTLLSTLALLSTQVSALAIHLPVLPSTVPPGVLGPYRPLLSNGSTTLPAPPSPLLLKSLGLGRGTQNYTCAATPHSAAAAPTALGARATLFDATIFLPYVSPIEGQDLLDLLPTYLLDILLMTLEDSVLPVLGRHFFLDPTTPIFDLGGMGTLVAAKMAAIGAPKHTLAKGAAGDVDWLMLTQKAGAASSGHLTQVYRVETAGGKPPATCAGIEGTFEVQYAAQYWFYGTA